ncbi:MAG: CAP domain-containing protein [Pseudomonadota bacterium]
MSRVTIFLICASILAACSEPVYVAPEKPTTQKTALTVASATPPNDLNRRAAQAINALRAENRRVPLVYSAQLNRAARMHAADMNRRQVMSHTGRDGSTPANRATRAGYRWCRIAENVAFGQPDLATVLQAWVKSPGHRRNMLDLTVSEFGIAKVGAYWTLVLGKPGC